MGGNQQKTDQQLYGEMHDSELKKWKEYKAALQSWFETNGGDESTYNKYIKMADEQISRLEKNKPGNVSRGLEALADQYVKETVEPNYNRSEEKYKFEVPDPHDTVPYKLNQPGLVGANGRDYPYHKGLR